MQAVSYAKALQTGQYRSTSASIGVPAYDPVMIEGCLGSLAREEARWRLWFARTGVQPLTLSYEELILEPAVQVGRIAELLGVTGAQIDPAGVTLLVQRDAITAEWVQRFREEKGSTDSIRMEFGSAGVPDPPRA
jgi:LPS sulfotransferase NodH